MAALLNRFKNAAASASTIGRSATPASSATSAASATQRPRGNLLKKHLYTNPVMSLSVVLGTLGVVVPTMVYLMGGGREIDRAGRLQRWTDEWQQSGEEARKQRILREVGDRHDDRLDALVSQLQKSGKYTAPQ